MSGRKIKIYLQEDLHKHCRPPWIRLLGLVQCQPLLGLDFLDGSVLAPSWIGLLELDCSSFQPWTWIFFLFCRALTLNLDLYFFSFFSYPGGEQHCFDYCFVLILAWTLKNFHFFTSTFDLDFLFITTLIHFILKFLFCGIDSNFGFDFDSEFLFQPDFSLGSFVTDNDIL
ncbi:unnamed protein product [Rhizophagus irregularis]|nr:unnamed protein product [Rhizophagus irregularis]